MGRVLALLSIVILFGTGAARAGEGPVRFGLTAAVVRENLDLYERWGAYLAGKVGRPVQFVQRRSYREAIELLQTGEHDFSWICSLPYAKYRDAKFFGLLAVPVFEGEPLYRSYLIVHKQSPIRRLDELQGKVFAYADPDSNTGYAVPRQLVHALGRNPDEFFRQTFFTYSHTETVEAVAEHVADGAAVDSYVWEYLNRNAPHLTADTRIIQRSQTFGFPPLVYRIGIDDALRARMTGALLNMDKDPEGRALLNELALDKFIIASSSLYDGVRLKSDPP